MTEVYLEYNPFSGKTKCTINGKDAVIEECWGKPDDTSRLQDWVARFFYKLHDRKNDDSYFVEFFAEVFANSQMGMPNELGKAMLKWLKQKGFLKE